MSLRLLLELGSEMTSCCFWYLETVSQKSKNDGDVRQIQLDYLARCLDRQSCLSSTRSSKSLCGKWITPESQLQLESAELSSREGKEALH